MFLLLFILLLSSSICQGYKELKKYSSVTVKSETKVYLDISSFKVGDLISFEIKMNLFFSSYRDSYTFQIGQITASSYYDPNCLNNLQTVINKNLTSKDTFDDSTFTWEEVKEEGKNYIFIITKEPYSGFFSSYGNKIKISNKGGLSSGSIAGIVVSVVLFVLIIVLIILLCRYCHQCCSCCSCCDCCCGCNCFLPIKRNYSVVIPTPNIQVQVQQPIYPQPVYPQPVYQQPVYQEPVYQQPVYPPPNAYNQPVY